MCDINLVDICWCHIDSGDDKRKNVDDGEDGGKAWLIVRVDWIGG